MPSLPQLPPSFRLHLERTSRFSWRVLSAFIKNKGLLLAGGVGYNVLLSAIPLLALSAVLLTQLVDEQRLFTVLALQAEHMAPAQSELMLELVREFLAARELIGITGLLLLVFFSSFAFSMLESAIAIIFHQPRMQVRRRFWVPYVLPYLFILLTGAGLFTLTLILTLLNVLMDFLEEWLGLAQPPGYLVEMLVIMLSFVGMALLFSAIYKIIPAIQVKWRRALVGGLVAAALWEVIRLLLVYYFSNVSFVSVIYGSAAAMVIILLSLEVAAVILLLGAQVIAELERSDACGLPWYQPPPEDAG